MNLLDSSNLLFAEYMHSEKVDLNIKSQEQRYEGLEESTRRMVRRMLDEKLQRISRNSDSNTKDIKDVVVKEHTNTQTVIIDALRQMAKEEKGKSVVVKSSLVEVSSEEVATSVLRHLKIRRSG